MTAKNCITIRDKVNMQITPSPILPPATIGILGGGQLGKMTAEAARHMGYRVLVVSESPKDPAAQWCDEHVCGNPSDPKIVTEASKRCAVLTNEFEQVSVAALEAAEAAGRKVAPASSVQKVVQDRRLEKTFLRDHGFPVGPFRIVEDGAKIAQAYSELAAPVNPGDKLHRVVAKTARGGYDGKGQRWLTSEQDAIKTWADMGGIPLVLEQGVAFVAETSVITARANDSHAASFPMFRNEHRNGILFQTVIPAGFSDATEKEARRVAEGISHDLGVVGLIAVEMFVLADGHVLVNELAARPHNSGHVTLRACTRSQFELHVQAICGLPLPAVDLLRPGVMTNLLGDLWHDGKEPDWRKLYESPTGTLHLYGKSPRPARKMGHMIHTGNTAQSALQEATEVFNALSRKPE